MAVSVLLAGKVLTVPRNVLLDAMVSSVVGNASAPLTQLVAVQSMVVASVLPVIEDIFVTQVRLLSVYRLHIICLTNFSLVILTFTDLYRFPLHSLLRSRMN